MSQAAPFTNRLAHETSPYLQQHAHNPVDWYPWGPEALERARQFDRPIFLSIGYSACHWCHVMEHESFEKEDVARILNEHFVSIKVDREERPDLDQIYMTAVQLMTGQGGWPMSMFLTPDLKPFYGGTYYPPEDRYGRPGFKSLLLALIDAWANRREQVEEVAGQRTEQLQSVGRVPSEEGTLDDTLIRHAVSRLGQAFDPMHGGFGSAPKFPHPFDLRLLLRAWKRLGSADALNMVRLTLDHMARGGIYDHLGGGFHRYSTDARWLVPHFEKMLYDNALLTVTYLEAFQATGDPFYRQIVEETLRYVRDEMTSPAGPFYSTQDADSEGEEGKFFVWSVEEIKEVLRGEEEAVVETFLEVYDVSEEGNWEGHNILHRSRTDQQEARLRHLDVSEFQRRLDVAKRKLFEARSQRVWPGRDEKILTAWNGLMIDAFAQAAQVLDQSAHAEVAAKAADFVLKRMRTSDGRLLRTATVAAEAKLNGYLEDYSFLINSLVSLYEATFAPRWIESALDLARVMIEQFWDPNEGGFFFTGKDHEALIVRTKEPQDNAVPSGNSMAVTSLLRLAKLTGRTDLLDKATATLRLFRGLLASHPTAAGQLLIALDFHLGPVQEFAVVGDPSEEATQRVLRSIRKAYRPKKVVALKSPRQESESLDALLPLLAGKRCQGEVTTYICQDFTCQAPLTGAEAVEQALSERAEE
jgi:uncharacterized protein YyaL (SSP411 family)